jgi:hypothetical protein
MAPPGWYDDPLYGGLADAWRARWRTCFIDGRETMTIDERCGFCGADLSAQPWDIPHSCEAMQEPARITQDRPGAADQVGGQVRPVPNREKPTWAVVVDDMVARDAHGRAKYGTPLQPFNGRDSLWDAYEEALDQAVYLRNAHREVAELRERHENLRLQLDERRRALLEIVAGWKRHAELTDDLSVRQAYIHCVEETLRVLRL